MLSNGSKVEEVLWNFSRQEQNRLSLTQNPHFYQNLPPSPYSYGEEFIADPIELVRDMLKVQVLTNGPGRVFLTCDQNPQVFYNVWAPKKALIFKGLRLAFLFFLTFPTPCQMSMGNSWANVLLAHLFKERPSGTTLGVHCFHPQQVWKRRTGRHRFANY